MSKKKKAKKKQKPLSSPSTLHSFFPSIFPKIFPARLTRLLAPIISNVVNSAPSSIRAQFLNSTAESESRPYDERGLAGSIGEERRSAVENCVCRIEIKDV
jgi:hypothetical protein